MFNQVGSCGASYREWWRPFALSVLEESASELLEDAQRSPFMTFGATVRPDSRKRLAAVTHVDGSTRR